MDHKAQIRTAVKTLRNGGLIAYPTEAVYGFGCDPFNSTAVYRLLGLKRRQPVKGFILVASEWSQIEHLTKPLPPQVLAHVQSTWPGPITWLFPVSDLVPTWIKGHFSKIALRISAHPIVRELCDHFCGPIVSSSANLEGDPPKRDYRSTTIAFKNSIDFIVQGNVSGAQRPTMIRDAMTDELIRE